MTASPSSPDRPSLEWMFQEPGVSDLALSQALVNQAGPSLLRLAWGIFYDRELAAGMALQALSEALAERRRFWGDVQLETWLSRRILKIARFALRKVHPQPPEPDHPLAQNGLLALSGLPPLDRAAAVLRYGLGLPPVEVAAALKRKEGQVEPLLRSGLAEIMSGEYDRSDPVDRLKLPESDFDLRALEKAAEKKVQGWLAMLNLTEEEIQSWPERMLAHARERAGTKRQSQILSALIGLLVWGFIIAGIGWYSQSGEKVVYPTITPMVYPSTTPVGSLPTFSPGELGMFYYSYTTRPGDTVASVAQKAGMTEDQVRQLNGISGDLYASRELTLLMNLAPYSDSEPPRAKYPSDRGIYLYNTSAITQVLAVNKHSQDYYRSLFQDVRIINYGPPGYRGAPIFEQRYQVWQYPYRLTTVYLGQNHPADSIMYDFLIWNNGVTLHYGIPNGPATADFSEQDIFPFVPVSEMNAGFAGEYSIGDVEIVAARPTVVLNWTSQDRVFQQRFWIDAMYGVLLQYERIWSPPEMNGHEVVLLKLVTDKVVYDRAFPIQVFTPPVRDPGFHFAVDETGRPEAYGAALPSVLGRFNPPTLSYPTSRSGILAELDHARLDLYFPGGQNPLAVYLNGTLWGRIPELAETIFYDCDRSPDGRLVALKVSKPNEPAPLYWFALDRMSDLHEIRGDMPQLFSGNFAFSPDSRQLAYLNFGPNGIFQLTLFDTVTQSHWSYSLADNEFAHALVWKPDGSQIAMQIIKYDSDKLSTGIKVFDLTTGNIVYTYEDYSSPYLSMVRMIFMWPSGLGWFPAPVVPPDSPTNDWGVSFPPLDNVGCMLP